MKSGCATPPASSPTSAGARIRTIAASSRSTSSRTPLSSASIIPGRAYIALAIFFRHVGLLHDEELSPRIRELASTRTLDRARVLGAALRVAYMVSASQPGVLPRTPMKVERHRLVLRLEGECAALAGERVSSRLKHLARLVGREPVVLT